VQTPASVAKTEGTALLKKEQTSYFNNMHVKCANTGETTLVNKKYQFKKTSQHWFSRNSPM
jgi:hypothetical protein